MDFTIHPIAEKDIEYVASVMSHRWDSSLEWSLKETRTYLAQNERVAGFCAYLGDKVVGVGLFSLHNEDVSTEYGPWLYLLWIEPEFRGNDLGILLTQKRMEHARQHGYTEIYLDTRDAAEYHRRLGWQDVGIINRNDEELIIMRWDLSQEFPAK